MLQNHQVDVINPFPEANVITTVQAISDVKSQVDFGLSFDHIEFNITTPGLDDLVVREAIATAIDRSQLVNLTVGRLSGKATIDNNRMFVPNQPQYKDTSGGLYETGDVAKSKQMLEGDGYRLGSDGVYVKGGTRLSFRISTVAGDAMQELTETLVKAQLKPAGIAVNVANQSSSDLFAKTLPEHNFDLGLFDWTSSPFPSGNTSRYSQGASANYGEFGSFALDQTLARGRGGNRSSERVGRFQRRRCDHVAKHVDVPALPDADLPCSSQHVCERPRQRVGRGTILERLNLGSEALRGSSLA